MMIDFDLAGCRTQSDKKVFGLCDDPAPAKNPAYIDEKDGSKWVAVVENEYRYEVTFTAIDNCIEVKHPDGTMDKRCDGMLTYESGRSKDKTVIFVELKQRDTKGNSWIKDAESQLKASIHHFEQTASAEKFHRKMACIANSEHPRFKSSQALRMEKFLTDTGYILRIEARIVLV